MSNEHVCFQAGSKNAAFYMGRTVKVVTKPADSPYVHELMLDADAMEQCYRDKKVCGRLAECFVNTTMLSGIFSTWASITLQ